MTVTASIHSAARSSARIWQPSRGSVPPPAPPGLAARLLHLLHLVGLMALAFWLLALVTYSPLDPAWSTTGSVAEAGNWGGWVGAWLADWSLLACGFSVAWVPAVGLSRWAVRAWRAVPQRAAGPWPLLRWGLGLAVLLAASAGIEWLRFASWDARLPAHAGGWLGGWLGDWALHHTGPTQVTLLAVVGAAVGSAWAFGFSWARVSERLGQWLVQLGQQWRQRRDRSLDLALGAQAASERAAERAAALGPEAQRIDPLLADGAPESALAAAPAGDAAADADAQAEPPAQAAALRPAPVRGVQIAAPVSEVPQSPRALKERQKSLFQDILSSKLPQIDLLDPVLANPDTVSAELLEMTSRLIEKKLRDFGVSVTVMLAQPGPVITRYEIEPATGVKGAQIVGLAKDLARSLSLVSIRVVETIPGKTHMALELPNAKRQTIRLSEILGSQAYHQAKSLLTMGLGKDIVGHPVVVDLAKMPHVLVAGTTGSGKSVGINAMILSLLYKAEPAEVRLIMIDPKMLEMSIYEGIPHLLAPVVTDMKQAGNALSWCVAEMERRYKFMSKVGVRNLAGYNTRIAEARARGEHIPNPFSLTPEAPEPLERLPHIVVVIDELADLMMVVGKKIEELIARLAQKARAAGIHLILATQRPSVDVITGLIKANIPTRIAFQVSSKIDSRTILDQMGAESLLGMGDMLYQAAGTGLPVRVHGAFVSDDEVHRVVNYLKSLGEPNYIEGLLEGGTVDGDDAEGGSGEGAAGGESDPLYDQAVEVVLKNRKASISLVQRHLKIGYNRAARLVEDMEKAGLVSAMSGSGQRDILVPARPE